MNDPAWRLRRRLRRPRTLSILLSLAVAAGLLGNGMSHPGAASTRERTVIELRGDPVDLASRLTALAALPARIRLAGLGYALVEVDAENRASVVAAVSPSRVLFTSGEPFDLFLVRESRLDATGRTLLASFTVFSDEREKLRVLALTPAESAALVAPARRGLAPVADHGEIELAGTHAFRLPESVSPRALAPLPALERANPYRQSRLSDPAVRARVLAQSGQVSAARIEQLIRDLSTGPGATRYSSRITESALVRAHLADTLRSIFSAPGDTVFSHPFAANVGEADTLYNLVARRRGERPGSGRYIIGGHYDSTAGHTDGWNPATDPAPGADDNATGVAAVIEAARVLTASRYDFDLEVILFGGEEQGLLGSKAYAADSALIASDEVLGVVTLDMVGYNPRAADSLNVITNLTSEWFADLMTEAESLLDGADGLDEFDKIVAPSFGRSDHAPFWNIGESALLLIENLEIEAHNPNYHQVTDTMDYLLAADGPDLVRRSAEVLVITLGQFATIAPEPPSPFVIGGDQVLFYDDEGILVEETVAGQPLELRMRIINSGATRPSPVRAHAVLDVNGAVMAEMDTVFSDWGRGVWQEVVVPWQSDEGDVGGAIPVAMQVTLFGDQVELAEFAATATIVVQDLIVREAYVRPNPIRSSLESGELYLRLTGSIDLRCRIFDAAGEEVGTFSGLVDRGQRVSLGAITEGQDLPSGVYVLRYEARVPGGGGSVASQTLPFAYVR